MVDVVTRERVSYARKRHSHGTDTVNGTYATCTHTHRKCRCNSWSPSDSRVLTISSDLPTVLQVLNEVVPNLEEVSAKFLFAPAIFRIRLYHIARLIRSIDRSDAGLADVSRQRGNFSNIHVFIVDTLSERFPSWQRRDRRAHVGASEPSGMHHRQRRSEDQGAPRGESLTANNYSQLVR